MLNAVNVMIGGYRFECTDNIPQCWNRPVRRVCGKELCQNPKVGQNDDFGLQARRPACACLHLSATGRHRQAKSQEIHDLGEPGAGELVAAGDLGVVFEVAVFDAVLDVVGQGQEAGGSDEMLLGQGFLTAMLPLFLLSVLALEADGFDPSAHASDPTATSSGGKWGQLRMQHKV